jgi:hypothetical protein
MTRALRHSRIAIGTLLVALLPAAAHAVVELGVDAGVTFGLGDQSSVRFQFPATRARAGFFLDGGQWSIEPAMGLGVDKIEGSDALFTYDLELGVLYHFNPFVVASSDPDQVITHNSTWYVRPFLGLVGFASEGNDDNEFSLGTGLGVKIPARSDLAWRLEGNVGYGFDNEALRIGFLAGVSFFWR